MNSRTNGPVNTSVVRTASKLAKTLAFIFVIFLNFSQFTSLDAQQFTFQEIEETPLDANVVPVLSNGQIAWSNIVGDDIIRFWDGTTTTTVLDNSSVIPGSSQNFTSVSSPQLSNGVITFRGIGGNPQQRGIYRYDGSEISTLVDSNTAAPGGNSNFFSFRDYDVDGTDLVFSGNTFSGGLGVYRLVDGEALSLVADTNTLRPGSTDTFTGFSGVVIDDGAVAFTAGNPNSSTQTGVYSQLTTNGELLELITENTVIPENGELFESPRSNLALDASTLVVQRFDGSGIYAIPIAGGDPTVVGDTSTMVPGENNRTFSSLGGGAIAGDMIAYVGRLPEGVYARVDGEFVPVIQRGDVLDGLTAQNFFLSDNGVSEDQIALRINFGLTPNNITNKKVYLISVVRLGDVNLDGLVNVSDISPFIGLLATGRFQLEADIDENGRVDFLDISPFIGVLSGQ